MNIITTAMMAVVCAAAHLCAPARGFAHQDSTDTDSLASVEMRSVEVSAEQARISAAAQRTEVVSSRELRRAACCSLAESFERSPSVEVSYSDAVSGARQIQMLGLSGLYTSVLVEATPLIRSIELPFGFDHIPGPFMDNISIAKGAGTVTNGYEGQTGQINVCLHDPFFAPALFANVYGNTVSRFEANVYGAQSILDELVTMTMLHGRTRKGPMDNNGDNFQDMPEFDQLNLVHRWRFNDDVVEFQAFVRGLLDRYSSGEITATANQPRYAIETEIDRLDGFVKAGLLNPFTGFDESGLSLTVTASTHSQHSTWGNSHLHASQQTINLRGIGSISLNDDVKVVGGLSFIYDDVSEQYSWMNVSTDSGQRIATRIERVPGAFLEATVEPIHHVTIVAGTRFDMHNLYGTRVVPRLNVKWQVASLTSIRASVGNGWRVPTVVTENMSALINSRRPVFDENFLPEQSWNTGASITHSLEAFGRPLTVDAEIYHTWFSNRVVVDFDRSVREVWISNLYGESYSTHLMGQLLYSPLERLELLVAWRTINVQAPLGNEQRFAPMLSRHRMLATVTWDSEDRMWTVDGSAVYASSGRLPTTVGNPAEYMRPTEFPGYWRFNAQVTWRYDAFEVYAGCENVANFIQADPVIAADAPYSEYFDASLAWASTSPRLVYIGARFELPQ